MMIPIDEEEEDGWMGEIGRMGIGIGEGFGCGHTLLVIYGMSCFLERHVESYWYGKCPLGWLN